MLSVLSRHSGTACLFGADEIGQAPAVHNYDSLSGIGLSVSFCHLILFGSHPTALQVLSTRLPVSLGSFAATFIRFAGRYAIRLSESC